MNLTQEQIEKLQKIYPRALPHNYERLYHYLQVKWKNK